MSIKSREKHRQERQAVHELDVAKGIQSGELPSPQQYENVWLFGIRVTGTGTSFRPANSEFVYRPPEDFLTEDFVQRCNGLPIVFEHPAGKVLDTDEYRERAIGSVILPWIAGDEVRGIARIYDADAAILMQTSHVSTSPAVVFRDASVNESIDLGDGVSLLIEGKPSYLDHLAICEEGVWDKGEAPNGIQLDEEATMAEKDESKQEAVPAWAEDLGKRFDALCGRMDALENKGGEEATEKADGAFTKLEDKLEDEGKSKESAEKIAGAAGEKKFGKEGMEKKSEEGKEKAERKDESEEAGRKEIKSAEEKEDREERVDSLVASNTQLKRVIAEMQANLSRVMTPLSNADRDALAVAQSRADSLAQMFGDSVTPPLHGETPIQYRKRLAAKFQPHSTAVKDIKLDSLEPSAFDLIEDRIYADALTVARTPNKASIGKLLAIRHRNEDTGQITTTYTGDIGSWMKHYGAEGMLVTKFNTTPQGA
ncbi:MAG: DUF2213 domain-containing protein [Acidobacteriaceae bacterium]